jgi:hypothetical protein
MDVHGCVQSKERLRKVGKDPARKYHTKPVGSMVPTTNLSLAYLSNLMRPVFINLSAAHFGTMVLTNC